MRMRTQSHTRFVGLSFVVRPKYMHQDFLKYSTSVRALSIPCIQFLKSYAIVEYNPGPRPTPASRADRRLDIDGVWDIRETWSQYWRRHHHVNIFRAVISLVRASHYWPPIGPCFCSQHLRGIPGMISVMWTMWAALIPDIIELEITSIRTQPETFSFTLLTCGGFKLKSWFLKLSWCKQF